MKRFNAHVSKGKEQWECDGCNKVVHRSPGDAETCGRKHHWRWMKVGSASWHDYHDNGEHPMKALTDKIRTATVMSEPDPALHLN